MKKIIALFFVIMMFSTVCGAFERPDTSKWWRLAASSDMEYWIDRDNMTFSDAQSAKYANAWVLVHDMKDNTQKFENLEINLDKRQIRTLSYVVLNSDGSQKESVNTPEEFRDITPGSLDEMIFDSVRRVYNSKSDFTKVKVKKR
ncbi:MAG: hypothetical protein LUD24_02815 [Phascolarctobacterium sp.]|nr:hypothetical protein [Phascolarctobacterium sp.]